ncbi:FIMAH domain-containing protein [Paenibacillus sp.]|uniref:FIMAH domain-containing protein n=1 Tax=Paenibacillus sp. TaxID=58172 RepID=UPI002D3A598C|nr:hypothetical protein [Paenibacillus sp.]HZG84585.1 hypothetical protein [Paenibacillus sp.]
MNWSTRSSLVKKLSSLCLAAALTAASWASAPEPAAARVDKSFGAPIDLGAPIESVAIYNASFGKENGRDVMYTTTSGKPAMFHVVDLISKEVLGKYPLPGSDAVWTHLTMPDGTVYIGGSGGGGSLYAYSPAAKQVTTIGSIGESVAYGLSHDERGRVYFGTYPNAKVGRYDPATGVLEDLGTAAPGQSYVRDTAYLNGYLYAGIGIQGSLVKIDVETGVKETISLPTYDGAVQTADVYQLDAAGKYVVAGLGGGNRALLFYDTETQTWADRYFLDNKGIQLSQGLPGTNTAYFVQNNRLMEIDLSTLEATDTGVTYGTFLRNTAWIAVPNDPDLPGLSLATVTFGGAVAYLNLETKTAKSFTYPVSGNPIPIQTLEKGPDGKLYMSGYPGGRGAVYDPAANAMTMFPLGQAEGMGSLGNKLYLGVYSGAVLYELDVTQPLVEHVNPKLLYDIPEEDRPFAMVSGEEKLFVGTIPDYGVLGGALTVYDPRSGAEPTVYKNVVPNQSIVGLAVRGGKLYGSTTVHGGLGIDPTEPAAKLFVWDIAAGEKIAEFVPNIPGVTVQPRMIGALSFGPDGLLWGATDGTIFAVHPDTLEVVKSRNIYPTVANYGRWRPAYIRWGQDGLMYTTLAGKLTVIDPRDLDAVTLGTTPLMTLGDDGHIYYAEGTQLKKIEVGPGTGELPVLVDLPVPNGNFDEPLTADGSIPGWRSIFTITPNVSYGVSTERYASAPASLKLTDASINETVAMMSQSVPVVGGVEYAANLKLYLESGRTLAVLRFYDAAGKQIDETSLQIQTGHGAWQTLEMKKVAPPGAASAAVILFCSRSWMTTAYYDDVSLSYTVKVTPSGLLERIDEYAAAGELAHETAMQLRNAVSQALHHRDDGRMEQAAKHLQDAEKHLAGAKAGDASEAARAFLERAFAAFIEDWSL